MIKTLVFTLVLLTVSVSAHAMTVSQQWSKVYGGDDVDYVAAIIQTIDGGYIAAGGTKSFGVGAHNMWILKLDANGEIEWQKTYGLDFANDAYSIKQTSDGGYIVAGVISDIGDVAACILKLDSNGNISWQRAYSEFNKVTGIFQTSDGGYVAIGGARIDEESLGHVFKFDNDGNVIWVKEFELLSSAFQLHNIQQTSDGGYIIAGYLRATWDINFLVLKVDSEGNTIWGKTYGGSGNDLAFSIQQTIDGGYIVAGDTSSFGSGQEDAWIVKLDNGGNIIWQKAYGGNRREFIVSAREVINDGYIVVGSFGSTDHTIIDMWVMKIDNDGEIIWQKTYGGNLIDNGVTYQATTDGGFIMAGNTNSFSINDTSDFLLFKLDSNGEIPDCNVIGVSDVTVTNTHAQVLDKSVPTLSISPIASDPNITPQNSSAETTLVCYYENPNDMDGDGMEDTPGGAMASSMFLDSVDNCPDMPNGPHLGTCTQGNVGSTCISDGACGVGGVCSMAQEDSFPPSGNGIGDACDCECDFDCSRGVDAIDVTAFLFDFGRSTFNNPCTNASPCNGDVDCNVNVDANDVNMFLEDFGRSQFNDPCPPCVAADWCVYP